MFCHSFFSWCILSHFPGLSFSFQPGFSSYPVFIQFYSSLSLCFALPACPDRWWGSGAGRQEVWALLCPLKHAARWLSRTSAQCPKHILWWLSKPCSYKEAFVWVFKAWVCLCFCAQLQELALLQALLKAGPHMPCCHAEPGPPYHGFALLSSLSLPLRCPWPGEWTARVHSTSAVDTHQPGPKAPKNCP